MIMLMFPSMLIPAAKKAGMKVPTFNKGKEQFNADKYPHFNLYCNAQLNRPITWGNHWENAKIIAGIPEEELRTITWDKLESLGFSP
jgi:hypothetical protein